MNSELSSRGVYADYCDVYARQAIELSADWIEAYESEHTIHTPDDRNRIAESRLQFILMEARAELSGYFTAANLFDLLNCFTGQVLDPAAIEEIADAVLDDCPEQILLAQKLEDLSRLQKVALADLLEQMCYRSEVEACSPLLIAEKLGVAAA